MENSKKANLVVIGAGSGGLVSAYIAAAINAKVILIEKNEMGGDCLNTGCVPSKSLIASAKHIYDLQHSENFGIKKVEVEFEFADVMARVHEIIAKIEPHDSVERYTKLGVEVIQGEAMIQSPNQVKVTTPEGEIQIETKNIIIAAGARPFVPPIKGIDEIEYLTSDTIWGLTELPKKMLVLGGGPIGCELAQCFNRFGSEVSIVEMGPQIMSREDTEIADYMTERFQQEGVNLLTGHKAAEFFKKDGRSWLRCENQQGEVELEFDAVLVAVGRAARVEGYGLENLQTQLTNRRTIEVNDYLQAGHDNVFAVGDVTGPYQFTHAAAHQAWYAAVNALFRPFKKFKVDYSVMPWTTYTDPEVARVGLNEKEAKAAGIAYEVTEYPLSDLDRAITDGHAIGKVKIITAKGKDKILGATIVGRHAGDLMAELVLAMRHGLGMNKILGTIHAYPTWMEANKFAAGNWKRAHAPAWALRLLQKFHRWRL